MKGYIQHPTEMRWQSPGAGATLGAEPIPELAVEKLLCLQECPTASTVPLLLEQQEPLWCGQGHGLAQCDTVTERSGLRALYKMQVTSLQNERSPGKPHRGERVQTRCTVLGTGRRTIFISDLEISHTTAASCAVAAGPGRAEPSTGQSWGDTCQCVHVGGH